MLYSYGPAITGGVAGGLTAGAIVGAGTAEATLGVKLLAAGAGGLVGGGVEVGTEKAMRYTLGDPLMSGREAAVRVALSAAVPVAGEVLGTLARLSKNRIGLCGSCHRIRSPFSAQSGDPEQMEVLSREAAEVGGDPALLSFNTGNQTSFDDKAGVIHVRGDVSHLTSTQANSALSSRAAIAHEFGHAKYPLPETRGFAPIRKAGDWFDEFRASYSAAKDMPGLSAEERSMLIQDAVDRVPDSRRAKIKWNNFMISTRFGM